MVQIPDYFPDWLTAMVLGHFPEGDPEAMRRSADTWSDAANGLVLVLHRLQPMVEQLEKAVEGETGTEVQKQYRKIIGQIHAQIEFNNAMARQLYDNATAIEYQQYVLIGIAGALLAQVIIDMAMPPPGSIVKAITDRAEARVGMELAERDLVLTMLTRAARFVAEHPRLVLASKGVFFGTAIGGGVPYVAQRVQIAQGHRKAVDWQQVRIGAAAGAVGGLVGVEVGRRVAPAAMRAGGRVLGTVAAGGVGGMAGGLAGGLTAFALTKGELRGKDLATMVWTGFGSGLVGSLGASVRAARAGAYAGVPEPVASADSGPPSDAAPSARISAPGDGQPPQTQTATPEPVSTTSEVDAPQARRPGPEFGDGSMDRPDDLTPEMMAEGDQILRDMVDDALARIMGGDGPGQLPDGSGGTTPGVAPDYPSGGSSHPSSRGGGTGWPAWDTAQPARGGVAVAAHPEGGPVTPLPARQFQISDPQVRPDQQGINVITEGAVTQPDIAPGTEVLFDDGSSAYAPIAIEHGPAGEMYLLAPEQTAGHASQDMTGPRPSGESLGEGAATHEAPPVHQVDFDAEIAALEAELAQTSPPASATAPSMQAVDAPPAPAARTGTDDLIAGHAQSIPDAPPAVSAGTDTPIPGAQASAAIPKADPAPAGYASATAEPRNPVVPSNATNSATPSAAAPAAAGGTSHTGGPKPPLGPTPPSGSQSTGPLAGPTPGAHGPAAHTNAPTTSASTTPQTSSTPPPPIAAAVRPGTDDEPDADPEEFPTPPGTVVDDPREHNVQKDPREHSVQQDPRDHNVQKKPAGDYVTIPGVSYPLEDEPPENAIPVIPRTPALTPLPADSVGLGRAFQNPDDSGNTPDPTSPRPPDITNPLSDRHSAAPETNLDAGLGKTPDALAMPSRYATEPNSETPGAPQKPAAPHLNPHSLEYSEDPSRLPAIGGVPHLSPAPPPKKREGKRLVTRMGAEPEDKPKRRKKQPPPPPPPPPVDATRTPISVPTPGVRSDAKNSDNRSTPLRDPNQQGQAKTHAPAAPPRDFTHIRDGITAAYRQTEGAGELHPVSQALARMELLDLVILSKLSPLVRRRVIDVVSAVEKGQELSPLQGDAIKAFVRLLPMEPLDSTGTLTDLELTELRLVAEDKSLREIGVLIGLKETTVRAHLVRIERKLGAEDRVTAVVAAIRKNILPQTLDDPADRARSPLPDLTPRETEVLALVAEGKSSPQIATQLDISVAAVDSLVERAGEKLGSPTRAGMVAVAVSTDVLPRTTREGEPGQALPEFTQREIEVLTLIAKGKTSAEIADDLALTPQTVESYASRINRKLGVGTRAGSVAIVIRTGIIPPIDATASDGAARPELTPREREVLGLVAQGENDNEIAAALGLTRQSVKTYVFNINQKFGTHHRAGMAAFALRTGNLPLMDAAPVAGAEKTGSGGGSPSGRQPTRPDGAADKFVPTDVAPPSRPEQPGGGGQSPGPVVAFQDIDPFASDRPARRRHRTLTGILGPDGLDWGVLNYKNPVTGQLSGMDEPEEPTNHPHPERDKTTPPTATNGDPVQPAESPLGSGDQPPAGSRVPAEPLISDDEERAHVGDQRLATADYEDQEQPNPGGGTPSARPSRPGPTPWQQSTAPDPGITPPPPGAARNNAPTSPPKVATPRTGAQSAPVQEAPDTPALVRAARNGDSVAFDLLRADLADPIVQWMSARMAGDRAAAEGLTEEVFTRAAAGIGRLRAEQNIKQWLGVIARNVLVEHRRYERLRDGIWASYTGPRNTESGPQGGLLARADRATVLRAVHQLPSDHRKVLVWRFEQDKTATQIAESMPSAWESRTVRRVERRAAQRVVELVAAELGVVVGGQSAQRRQQWRLIQDADPGELERHIHMLPERQREVAGLLLPGKAKALGTSPRRLRETLYQQVVPALATLLAGGVVLTDHEAVMLTRAAQRHDPAVLAPYVPGLDPLHQKTFEQFFMQRRTVNEMAAAERSKPKTIYMRVYRVAQFMAQKVPRELRESYTNRGLLQSATTPDVAREAGVSQSTAEKVLRGQGEFAPETRRRVLEAADRLGHTFVQREGVAPPLRVVGPAEQYRYLGGDAGYRMTRYEAHVLFESAVRSGTSTVGDFSVRIPDASTADGRPLFPEHELWQMMPPHVQRFRKVLHLLSDVRLPDGRILDSSTPVLIEQRPPGAVPTDFQFDRLRAMVLRSMEGLRRALGEVPVEPLRQWLPGFPEDRDTEGFLRFLTGEWTGQVSRYRQAGWAEMFTDLEIPGRDPFAAILEQAIFMIPARFEVLHGRLGRENIRIDRGRITAITGWAGALIGDPAFDWAWLNHRGAGDYVPSRLRPPNTPIYESLLHVRRVVHGAVELVAQGEPDPNRIAEYAASYAMVRRFWGLPARNPGLLRDIFEAQRRRLAVDSAARTEPRTGQPENPEGAGRQTPWSGGAPSAQPEAEPLVRGKSGRPTPWQRAAPSPRAPERQSGPTAGTASPDSPPVPVRRPAQPTAPIGTVSPRDSAGPVDRTNSDIEATNAVDLPCAVGAFADAWDLGFDVRQPVDVDGPVPAAAVSWLAGAHHRRFDDGLGEVAQLITDLGPGAGMLVNVRPVGAAIGHLFLLHNDGKHLWIHDRQAAEPKAVFDPRNFPFAVQTTHALLLTRQGSGNTLESRQQQLGEEIAPADPDMARGRALRPVDAGALPPEDHIDEPSAATPISRGRPSDTTLELMHRYLDAVAAADGQAQELLVEVEQHIPDTGERAYVQRFAENERHAAALAEELGIPLERLRTLMAEELRKLFDGEIVTRATSGSLRGILGSGRFKTEFDFAGQSRMGRSLLAGRVALEQALFGYPPDLPTQSRPIYGFIRTAPSYRVTEGDALAQYGDIDIVFKSAVEERTTANVGDTKSVVAIPSRVTDPQPESFAATPHGHKTLGYIGLEGIDRDYTGKRFTGSTYIEAQVHGATVADIDYVVFHTSPPDQHLRELLDAAGIPWSHFFRNPSNPSRTVQAAGRPRTAAPEAKAPEPETPDQPPRAATPASGAEKAAALNIDEPPAPGEAVSARPAALPGTTTRPAPPSFAEFRTALCTALAAATEQPAPEQVLADATAQQMRNALRRLTRDQLTVIEGLKAGATIVEIAHERNSGWESVVVNANQAVKRVVRSITKARTQSDRLFRALAEATPQQIQEALRTLGPARRVVMGLFRDRQNVADIAVTLGLDEATIRLMAAGAVKRMAREIAKNRGEDIGPDAQGTARSGISTRVNSEPISGSEAELLVEAAHRDDPVVLQWAVEHFLKGRQRQVGKLLFVDGASVKDAAKATNLSESQIAHFAGKARVNLAKHLSERLDPPQPLIPGEDGSRGRPRMPATSHESGTSGPSLDAIPLLRNVLHRWEELIPTRSAEITHSQVVQRGQSPTSKSATKRSRTRPMPSGHAGTGLTGREVEVIGLAAQGLSVRDIALTLGIAPHSAESHLGRARRKLVGTGTRAEAIAEAERSGIFGENHEQRTPAPSREGAAETAMQHEQERRDGIPTPRPDAASEPGLVVQAIPHAELTAALASYGDTGDGWTGADSTYSRRLPDGRHLWMFSDTFLGTVHPDGSRPATSPMVKNTFVVDDQGRMSTVHGGTADAPTAVVPSPKGQMLWVGGGYVTGDVLNIMLVRFVNNDPDDLMWGLTWDENVLARFDADDLSLIDLTPMPSQAGVMWSAWLDYDGTHTYVYGTEESGSDKFMHVARVSGDDLRAQWEFFDGERWTPNENDSARIMPGVANEYSVTRWRDRYLLITQDTSAPFSAEIWAYLSDSPTGPFTLPTLVYRAPEAGADGSFEDPNVYAYNAHEHPDLRSGDTLIVSYNVNSLDFEGVVGDVSKYRPRFVTVRLNPGFGSSSTDATEHTPGPEHGTTPNGIPNQAGPITPSQSPSRNEDPEDVDVQPSEPRTETSADPRREADRSEPDASDGLDPATNPVLAAVLNPAGDPAFDRMKAEHFPPVFEYAMRMQLAAIDDIVGAPGPWTADNALRPFVRSGLLLGAVKQLFAQKAAVDRDAATAEAEPVVAELQDAHANRILTDPASAEIFRYLHEHRSDLELSDTEIGYLERKYQDFENAGAYLSTDQEKHRLSELNSEVAVLQTAYKDNQERALEDIEIRVDDAGELRGLTGDQIESARSRAGEDGGYLLPKPPSISGIWYPYLTYLSDPALRQRIYEKVAALAIVDHDNSQNVLDQVRKLAERAEITGKNNHAEYVMSSGIFDSVATVRNILDRIARAAATAARIEIPLLAEAISTEQIRPWDRYRALDVLIGRRVGIDEQMIREFFELDRVLEKGVFRVAEDLFELTITELVEQGKPPVWHEDVRVFAVLDKEGQHLTNFYFDPYARKGKNGGEWTDPIRLKFTPTGQRPLISVHLNLEKPPTGKPTLLAPNQLDTLFHEFGHALHFLLGAGTHEPAKRHLVFAWIEFVAKVFQQFWKHPDVVENYAVHHRTGEPMPPEMLEKLDEWRTAYRGTATVFRLAGAYVDLGWNSLSSAQVPSGRDPRAMVQEFEEAVLRQAGIYFSEIGNPYPSQWFRHLFAQMGAFGTYSGQYWSYLLSDVLALTVFGLRIDPSIEQHSGLTPETGKIILDEILRYEENDLAQATRRLIGPQPALEHFLSDQRLLWPEALLELGVNATPQWLSTPAERPPGTDLESWWNERLTPALRAAMIQAFPTEVLAMDIALSPETVAAAEQRRRTLLEYSRDARTATTPSAAQTTARNPHTTRGPHEARDQLDDGSHRVSGTGPAGMALDLPERKAWDIGTVPPPRRRFDPGMVHAVDPRLEPDAWAVGRRGRRPQRPPDAHEPAGDASVSRPAAQPMPRGDEIETTDHHENGSRSAGQPGARENTGGGIRITPAGLIVPADPTNSLIVPAAHVMPADPSLEELMERLSPWKEIFSYFWEFPLPREGEPSGREWIESSERKAWMRRRAIRRAPLYAGVDAAVRLTLGAERLLKAPNATHGPATLRQRRVIPGRGEIDAEKKRTMDADAEVREANRADVEEMTAFEKFWRRVSGDELPQTKQIRQGELAYVGGRLLRAEGHNLMVAGRYAAGYNLMVAGRDPVLTPEEYALWLMFSHDALWTVHYPGCRELEPQSPDFLLTRYLTVAIFDKIASKPLEVQYLDHVVRPYLRRQGVAAGRVLLHELSHHLPNSCRSTMEQLGVWALRGLGRKVGAEVEEHLDNCAACRNSASTLPAADSSLGGRKLLVPPGPVGDGSTEHHPASRPPAALEAQHGDRDANPETSAAERGEAAEPAPETTQRISSLQTRMAEMNGMTVQRHREGEVVSADRLNRAYGQIEAELVRLRSTGTVNDDVPVAAGPDHQLAMDSIFHPERAYQQAYRDAMSRLLGYQFARANSAPAEAQKLLAEIRQSIDRLAELAADPGRTEIDDIELLVTIFEWTEQADAGGRPIPLEDDQADRRADEVSEAAPIRLLDSAEGGAGAATETASAISMRPDPVQGEHDSAETRRQEARHRGHRAALPNDTVRAVPEPDETADLGIVSQLYAARMPDGRTVHFRLLGNPFGYPILFSPGTPVGVDGPLPDPRQLSDRGFTLIVVERPGYGDSDPLPGRTVADCARDIIHIATELFAFDRYSVLGRSGGGSVAIAVGALDPDHVDRVVSLVGTAPRLDDMGKWMAGMADANQQIYARADIEAMAAMLTEMAENIARDGEWLLRYNQDAFTRVDHMWVGTHRKELARGYQRALRNYPQAWADDAIQLTGNWGIRFDQYRVPVDIVHGAADQFSPVDHSRDNARLIPTSKLYLFRGVSHMMGMDALPVIASHFRAERDAFYRARGDDHRMQAIRRAESDPLPLPKWMHWSRGRWDLKPDYEDDIPLLDLPPHRARGLDGLSFDPPAAVADPFRGVPHGVPHGVVAHAADRNRRDDKAVGETAHTPAPAGTRGNEATTPDVGAIRDASDGDVDLDAPLYVAHAPEDLDEPLYVVTSEEEMAVDGSNEPIYFVSPHALPSVYPALRDLLPVEEYRHLGGDQGVVLPRTMAVALRDAAVEHGQPMSGSYNNVYLLGDFAIRIPKEGPDRLDFVLWPKEYQTLHALAQAGVQGVPRVLHVELDDQGDVLFEIQRRIYGEPVTNLHDLQMLEAVVAANHQLNEVPVPQTLLPLPAGYPESGDSVGFFRMLMEFIEQNYQRYRSVEPYRTMLGRVGLGESLRPILEPELPYVRSQPFIVIHGDLTNANILATPRGYEIVDFGLALYGPKDYEAAVFSHRSPSAPFILDRLHGRLGPWLHLLDLNRVFVDTVRLVDAAKSPDSDDKQLLGLAWNVAQSLARARQGSDQQILSFTEILQLAHTQQSEARSSSATTPTAAAPGSGLARQVDPRDVARDPTTAVRTPAFGPGADAPFDPAVVLDLPPQRARGLDGVGFDPPSVVANHLGGVPRGLPEGVVAHAANADDPHGGAFGGARSEAERIANAALSTFRVEATFDHHRNWAARLSDDVLQHLLTGFTHRVAAQLAAIHRGKPPSATDHVIDPARLLGAIVTEAAGRFGDSVPTDTPSTYRELFALGSWLRASRSTVADLHAGMTAVLDAAFAVSRTVVEHRWSVGAMHHTVPAHLQEIARHVEEAAQHRIWLEEDAFPPDGALDAEHVRLAQSVVLDDMRSPTMSRMVTEWADVMNTLLRQRSGEDFSPRYATIFESLPVHALALDRARTGSDRLFAATAATALPHLLDAAFYLLPTSNFALGLDYLRQADDLLTEATTRFANHIVVYSLQDAADNVHKLHEDILAADSRRAPEVRARRIHETLSDFFGVGSESPLHRSFLWGVRALWGLGSQSPGIEYATREHRLDPVLPWDWEITDDERALAATAADLLHNVRGPDAGISSLLLHSDSPDLFEDTFDNVSKNMRWWNKLGRWTGGNTPIGSLLAGATDFSVSQMQLAVLRQYPHIIGAAPGIEYRARDLANRLSLARDLESPGIAPERRQELATLRDQLAEVRHRAFGLASPGSAPPPVLLISYDPIAEGGTGRSVVSIGEADSASFIAFNVTGADTPVTDLSHWSGHACRQFEKAQQHAPRDTRVAIMFTVGSPREIDAPAPSSRSSRAAAADRRRRWTGWRRHPSHTAEPATMAIDNAAARDVAGDNVMRELITYDATRELALDSRDQSWSRRSQLFTVIGHGDGIGVLRAAADTLWMDRAVDQIVLVPDSADDRLLTADQLHVGTEDVYTLNPHRDRNGDPNTIGLIMVGQGADIETAPDASGRSAAPLIETPTTVRDVSQLLTANEYRPLGGRRGFAMTHDEGLTVYRAAQPLLHDALSGTYNTTVILETLGLVLRIGRPDTDSYDPRFGPEHSTLPDISRYVRNAPQLLKVITGRMPDGRVVDESTPILIERLARGDNLAETFRRADRRTIRSHQGLILRAFANIHEQLRAMPEDHPLLARLTPPGVERGDTGGWYLSHIAWYTENFYRRHYDRFGQLFDEFGLLRGNPFEPLIDEAGSMRESRHHILHADPNEGNFLISNELHVTLLDWELAVTGPSAYDWARLGHLIPGIEVPRELGGPDMVEFARLEKFKRVMNDTVKLAPLAAAGQLTPQLIEFVNTEFSEAVIQVRELSGHTELLPPRAELEILRSWQP
ncbi:alpha/beta fold hydrolase [Nocardia exalbida]|uniref:alpha/beta fold hydrolase n=1 Tax=Nocardia exalbida TaxID=290231 RepID=UPI00030F6598|nr:alpha/beta fold hydrolase [Nocardia exalbida]